MDSPQSVVSPLKTSSVKQNTNLSKEVNCQENGNSGDLLGVLEVCIHQARDIHNICIYQKQDVYAKLCLTSDPESTFSTKIINGGGRNPIFNENLHLDVRKVDSSLKCEIWMLSRVRNYLEDQLLGFALVPISEVLLQDGKLEKEFSLSSTDLFHSPAGFVQLSVSYVGAPPEVIPIPAPPTSVASDSVEHDTVASVESPLGDLDKIEFPDPKVVNENNHMVQEYFGMPGNNLDARSSDNKIGSGDEKQVIDSPQSSVSTNGTNGSESIEAPKDSSKPPNEEHIPSPEQNSEEKIGNGLDSESKETPPSVGMSSNDALGKPVVAVKIEPESQVVQKDIVDMYMKSMQQFTESLAKMKLPMDFESGPTSSGNSSSDQKSQDSKNSGSRVFYGSRAFF